MYMERKCIDILTCKTLHHSNTAIFEATFTVSPLQPARPPAIHPQQPRETQANHRVNTEKPPGKHREPPGKHREPPGKYREPPGKHRTTTLPSSIPHRYSPEQPDHFETAYMLNKFWTNRVVNCIESIVNQATVVFCFQLTKENIFEAHTKIKSVLEKQRSLSAQLGGRQLHRPYRTLGQYDSWFSTHSEISERIFSTAFEAFKSNYIII